MSVKNWVDIKDDKIKISVRLKVDVEEDDEYGRLSVTDWNRPTGSMMATATVTKNEYDSWNSAIELAKKDEKGPLFELIKKWSGEYPRQL